MFLASIFTTLYELLVGANADYPEYREEIFDTVGFFTFLASGIIALLFYIALGRWKMIWYHVGHWVITLIISVLIGFALSFVLTKGEIGLVDGYLIRFALFNSLYAAIFFFIFSLLFKRFSIFSKHVPF